MITDIRTKPGTGFEDAYSSASVVASAGNNVVAPVKVVSFRVQVGRRAYIRALGNVVAAGGEAFVTFRLLFNGARQHPYDGSQNQWGDPALLQDLPRWLPVPAGALVEVECANSDAANAYTATARVWVEYEDF